MNFQPTGDTMTELQKRILYAMTVLCIVVNSCCLGICLWSDYQLEKSGISIEAILAEQGRK